MTWFYHTGRLLLLTGLGLFLAPRVQAEGRGDEVVVVYNKRLPESKELADYYALKRSVPAKQVFGFDLPGGEDMTRAEFEKQLQEPLAAGLEKNGLFEYGTRAFPGTNGEPGRSVTCVRAATVRYAVLCYGVPVKITPDPTRSEPGSTNLPTAFQRNEAAVDSELALLPMVKERLPLTGPLRNFVFGATNAVLLHPTNGILMVTRLDGPTPEIARGLVDKALQAERDGLWGRAYFDVRGLPKASEYFLGDEWIRGAAKAAQLYGFSVYLDEAPATLPAGFPLSQVALYAGWYDGEVSGPFTRPNVEFMPGAIAYHLHSYSAGVVRDARKHWVGPLLARGATATMGCVTEPYLSATPDLNTFFSRLLLLGFTLGEAAYASQSVLSWQTTVIGDPLYRPCSRSPAEMHFDLVKRKSPLVEWSEERVVNLNLVKGTAVIDMETYLHEQELTSPSPVLLEKLAELYDQRGKPYSAAFTRLKAFRLTTSPQQAVRLVLAALPQLLEQRRYQEALDALQKLLRDQPDHPDRLTFLKAALPIAEILEQKGVAAQLSAEITRLAPPPPSPDTNQPAAASQPK